MVGRGVGVREAEDGQRPHRRRLDEPDRRLQHRGARALGADERAGDVEPVLRQQLVEVVARDPPGELGERRAHGRADPIGQLPQRRRPRTRPDGEPFPPVGEDVERVHVVDGLAPRHRVRPARVVADHAAERAAVVRGRVGAEGEAVRSGGGAQGVEHDPGLHAGGARLGVDRDDGVHPGEVQHHRGVDGLPRDRRARADRQQRHLVLPADRDGGGHVLGVAGGDDPDRHPPVVRRVGRPHRAGGRIEPHRPPHDPRQVVGEPGSCAEIVAPTTISAHRHHQFSTERVRMPAMSSSVGVRGQVASSRCCFIVPGTRSGTSSSV